MYAMTNVALIVFWFRERAAGTTHRVMTRLVPVSGVAVMAIPYRSSFAPDQASPYDKLPWYFAGLLAIGIAYAAILQARKPDIARNAGALIMGEAAEAPAGPRS